LQLWLAFLLVCVLTGFGFAVYQLQRVNHFSQIDGELDVRVAALNQAVRDAPFTRRAPPPRDGPPPEGVRKPPPAPSGERPSDLSLSSGTAALFGEGDGGYYYMVWYRDGTVLKRSAGAPLDLPSPQSFQRDTLTHWRTRRRFREAFHCSGLGDCALAGRSIEADVAVMRNFALALVTAGGAVLALALGVGWWLTTRAIRPIEQISAAASRISQGNLSERIQAPDAGSELGRLAGVLNSTFARLESAFAQQRQFTADAAHELRTPLAVIICETQTALARERTATGYREVVEACLDTAQQMRRLVESLIELSRSEAGDGRTPRGVVDLADRARCGVERISPLAEQRGIRILSDFSPAYVFGVAEKLDEVISNLLINAIHYNKEDGEVQIATRMDDGAAVLTVSDTGIGISAADLPYIFDRFYRVDKARSRAEGHTGLGLAICKAIVDAEQGTIEVSSALHAGTTFKVRLPRERLSRIGTQTS
jgi:two-component system OmpR family sensor kinase